MQTIEDRLRTVVSLLPSATQSRFATPLAAGESADSRLVEAVKALATSEGLICSTKEEVARVKARLQIASARPAEPPISEPTPAERITACKNPQQQTATWRSLTPSEKFDAVKGR